MKINVKGHSGCQIDVVQEADGIYIYKSSADPKYLARLEVQGKKQQQACDMQFQHIRVPKVYEIKRQTDVSYIKMQYIYSKDFIEFFEQAGFEQMGYLVGALINFIEYEVTRCQIKDVPPEIFRQKFGDIKNKCLANPLYCNDNEILSLLERSERVFSGLPTMRIPVGLCHGDLTFSNILFNGNDYYLIDFLDSFIETPLQDIVKLRQDTCYHWSQLMYTKRYDGVRLHIVLDKIDCELDRYFRNKYEWYCTNYPVMQLMNILRILPYASEKKVVAFLKDTLGGILDEIYSKNYTVSGTDDSLHNISSINTPDLPVKHNLIVPAAADKPEYENNLPYIFGLNKDGLIICIESIMGLNLKQFDNIYFTILKKHDEHFFVGDNLRLQFKRLGISNAKVVVLDNPTLDQSETIYSTIIQENIQGSIFIKDADSFFRSNLIDKNAVALYPIEELDVLTPKDKSYAAVDDMHYLTNIIEKTVVGHYISAGGYAIDNVKTFLHYYGNLRNYGHLYLSHIIYAMLLDKKSFRPMMVEEYKDWGTRIDLKRYE